MSPMRQIAEAVRRVPSVQDVNIVTTMENIPDTPVNDQWDDSIEVTPELNPHMDNRIPSNVNPSLQERENTSGDPTVVVEHVILDTSSELYDALQGIKEFAAKLRRRPLQIVVVVWRLYEKSKLLNSLEIHC